LRIRDQQRFTEQVLGNVVEEWRNTTVFDNGGAECVGDKGWVLPARLD
jgi:hypothetical protein